MYETFSEWLIVPYFQWGLHLSLEKTSNFRSPYPTRLWSERFHFEDVEEEEEAEEQATKEEEAAEEEDDDDEEDEE